MLCGRFEDVEVVWEKRIVDGLFMLVCLEWRALSSDDVGGAPNVLCSTCDQVASWRKQKAALLD